jgi:ATP-binding cassette subfamily F protein uup
MTPVKSLSGGECNRLLLAKLFSQPANLLVLDEPTNDLDIETLELLEELLSDFPGTLLIVSHDRTFLDNVVTSTLIFEGDGKIEEYIGGYQNWLQQRKVQEPEKTVVAKVEVKKSVTAVDTRKKLSYKEQKMLVDLPKQIEKWEGEQVELQNLVASPEFYRGDADKIAETLKKVKQLEVDLAEAYKAWEELESKNT